jgi:hypothetical protein
MRYCLLVLLFCIPCHAEKLAFDFKAANQLALKNAEFLKYKLIKKSLMNENNLSILEWCIEENDAWKEVGFNLVFELNYEGEISQSFKDVDSSVADCFILNIKKTGYSEPRVSHYYVAAPIIMLNGGMTEEHSSAETEEDLQKLRVENNEPSSYNQSQKKWLEVNVLNGL